MMKRPRSTQSKLAAIAIIMGCILYIVCSIINPTSFDYDETLINDGNNRYLLADAPAEPEPDLAVNEQVYKLCGDFRHRKPERKLIDVLTPRRLHLNLNKYHWKECPAGQDMFLGDVGITFRETQDSVSAGVALQKYLRFRLERKDDRSCLWNYSKVSIFVDILTAYFHSIICTKQYVTSVQPN